MYELQRYEEALTAFERSTQLEPTAYAYDGTGDALSALARRLRRSWPISMRERLISLE